MFSTVLTPSTFNSMLTCFFMFGESFFYQMALAIVASEKDQAMRAGDPAETLNEIRSITSNTPSVRNPIKLLLKACSFTVNPYILDELLRFYNNKNSKKKRVLIVATENSRRPKFKWLPNLPELEDDTITDCNVVEETEYEESSLLSKKINDSFVM